MAAGINGLGVGVATGGALLLYAAIRDVSPLDALRDIASGKAPKITSRPGWRSIEIGQAVGGAVGDLIPSATVLIAAARQYRGDQYSQARRWQRGYSDCSSFVGKAFKAIGVAPPGGSTTGDYLAWPKLKKVKALAAGDLLVSPTHMAIVTGPGTAIGQQNPRRDVVEGPISEVMYGSGAYVTLRYTGTINSGSGQTAAA